MVIGKKASDIFTPHFPSFVFTADLTCMHARKLGKWK